MAIAATYGVDPTWMARSDPAERRLIVRVVEEAADYGSRRDRRLANMIIEELSKAMSRKK